jgi:hypothetical protein
MTERVRRTDDGTYPDAGEELAKLAARSSDAAELEKLRRRLLPQAAEEVAAVIENARNVVSAKCSCLDCLALIDRAIANLTEWRELLARKVDG